MAVIRRTRRSRRRALAIWLLAGIVASSSACGARWSDEQRNAIVARGQGVQGAGAGTGQASGASGPGAAGTAPGAPVAGAPDASTGGPAGGPAAADPGASPEQAAPGAQAATDGGGGSAPCAAPSDAPGVTDTEIRVGSISSLSGPIPGIGASAAGAVRSYVAYRNANGGVCGRKIVLKEADDGTDNGRYRSLVSGMDSEVLGLAGGFGLGDVGGSDVVEQRKLPVVNVPGADSVTAVSTVFDINPPFENPDEAIPKYRYLHEQGSRKVSLTYLAVDQSRSEAQKQRRLMEAAGLEIVQVQELPLSTLSYDPAARGVANSGADYLFFIADTRGNSSMARAMADTGYKLKFAEYFAYAYATDFIEQAGPAAEGAMTWSRTLPNEDAGSSPEMAAYVEWMGRTAPNEPLDPFAADSWAGAKAFFDSLQALPGPITREALVAQLAAVETFDAGGMLGPIRLGAELTNHCLVGLKVESGKWKRMTPADGFLC